MLDLYQLVMSMNVFVWTALGMGLKEGSVFVTPVLEECVVKGGLISAMIKSIAMRVIASLVPSVAYAVMEQALRPDAVTSLGAWLLVLPMHVLVAITGARYQRAGVIIRVGMHSLWNYFAMYVIDDVVDYIAYPVMAAVLFVYAAIAIFVWKGGSIE